MKCLKFSLPLTTLVNRSILVFAMLLSGGACAEPSQSNHSVSDSFGSYERPFSARSYWNIRPVGARLGYFQIPDSHYHPLIGEGPFSSAAFLARKSDSPMKVYGRDAKKGLWELDGEQFVPSVTIARWPASTMPASGSDGHADIVDPITGVIHSFLDLKKDGQGRWTASMYAWTRLDGRGWAEPAQYYQGARAAAVVPMAGLIRKHEVHDGKPMYSHALAVSLTFNALSGQTGYVFPATSTDRTYKRNSGKIPLGALLMLPETFDTGRISDPALRKVAETLKVHGAYVVDRNEGTPFYIYVENGSQFNLHKPKWNSEVAKGLKEIQKGLRQVMSVQGWVDGNGQAFSSRESLNMISMRGPWVKTSGTGTARFDTWSQSLIIHGTSQQSLFQHRNNRSFNSTNWGKMQAGKRYRLQLRSTEGARLELKVMARGSNRELFNSGWMKNGETVVVNWPEDFGHTVLSVLKPRSSGNTAVTAKVRALVYPLDDRMINPLESVDATAR